MSKFVRSSALAAAFAASAFAVAPAHAQAAPVRTAPAAPATQAAAQGDAVAARAAGPARYRAEMACFYRGRWGKIYVKTDGNPTRLGQLANVVEWGYAIERSSGNHRNSSIYTYSAKNLAGRWYRSGGPGYVNRNAIEDNRWHKGPLINPRPIGYPRNGTLAVAFEFTFDRNSRTTCGGQFDARALRRI
ncbi:hypothetical protein [Actinomadura hibisca]|uniref:hypothetical protein n=1 Tax=Actinomadura hibisca TaxID=68565 RepID=UPI0008318E93|nr:hypothetical protein [Actinomadura hibisca]